MDKQKLIVKGGNRIEGELALHGAKNAALPLLAATVLIKDGECVIHNCPRLTDVDAALRILSHIGVKCRRDGSTVISDASAIGNALVNSFLRLGTRQNRTLQNVVSRWL